MARRFGSTSFVELLPNSLAQDEGVARIAESIDGVISKSARSLPELLIYARLALARPQDLLATFKRLAELGVGVTPVSEALLDILAWQFHVDGYEAAVTYEDKRRLVDRSLLMHRRKGTPWAVAEALRSLGYADARIFEGGGVCRYDGELNYDGRETHAAGNRWALFDVEIDLGDDMGVSAASVARLRVAIEAWKNARSHLRSLRWKATIKDDLEVDDDFAFLATDAFWREQFSWGFPRYDGAINHDNAIFRRHDGVFVYDGKRAYWPPEATGYRYDNEIERLTVWLDQDVREIVAAERKYDAFLSHDGSEDYGASRPCALEKHSVKLEANLSDSVAVRDGLSLSVKRYVLHDGAIWHNASALYTHKELA